MTDSQTDEAHTSLFPRTAWSTVLRTRGGDGDGPRDALETLCGAYWKPLVSYVAALGCTRADAEDVVQDFFGNFLRREGFQKADPERGRLRGFLKTAVRRHLHHWWRDRTVAKRGGGSAPLSLNEAPEQEMPAAEADAHFDREWALATLEAALEELRAGFEKRGRLPLYETLKPGLLGDAEKSVAELAGAAGITPGAMAVEIHRARKKLADALRARVAATVDADADVPGELAHLLRCIAEA